MEQSSTPLERFESRLSEILEGRTEVSGPGLDAAMRACWLRLIASFNELLCLSELKIERLPYQQRIAKQVLGKLRGRAILADEVGLGKSIEAGIILKELMLRSMARRVLVLAPPSLLCQWQEELLSKFDIPSDLFPEKAAEIETGVFLLSAARAKREPLATQLTERTWDLVIVDEAHHLKNRASAYWRFLSRLKSKYLLLLTATPVQNSLEDLFNLITLLKPGQLGSPAQFKRRFVESGSRSLIPRNLTEFRGLLGDVMVRTSRGSGIEPPSAPGPYHPCGANVG